MSIRWIVERRAGLVLGAVVAVPMLFTAVTLFPELAIPVPSTNDDATHFALIRRASEALASGENVLDHWVPQLELGFPWFIYYQPLPALVIVLLHRGLLGLVDLLNVFDAVRFALLVGLPLTVFWSLRRIGVAAAGAAVAAAASPLISGDFRYGFEYDSYVWRGFGMFTQLAAMHLSFVALATAWRALSRGDRRDIVWAALALAALVLTHLVYAYMMAITLGVLVIAGATSRRALVDRALRLVVLGLPAAAMTAWLWLPFLAQESFLGASPYLQPEKYDSYGAPTILRWLATGDLLDHGRLPVITALLGLGLVAAAMTRTVLARAALAGFVVWLVLYFGRPTLGVLVSVLPMHDTLLMHRFIGSVELFALVLVGIGVAWLHQGVGADASPLRLVLAGVAATLLLAPAMVERAGFYALNATWMRQTEIAIEADADAGTILNAVREQPGRVFAGLRSSGYGPQLNFGIPFNSVRFSDWLIYSGVAVVASPYSSVSLNADLFWDFALDRPEQYQLLDVRYVVAPSSAAMPPFLRPIVRTGRYVLYGAPTTGSAMYGALIDRQSVRTQRSLFAINRPWFSGPDAALRFHRFDFPAPADATTAAAASACARPTYGYERVQPARLDLLVGCQESSTLVLKITYHPNWHVQVDGREVTTFMVSPSLIGVGLDAGDHFVTAEYRSTPSKMPLVLLALATCAALFAYAYRERLARVTARARSRTAQTRVGRAVLRRSRFGLTRLRSSRASSPRR